MLLSLWREYGTKAKGIALVGALFLSQVAQAQTNTTVTVVDANGDPVADATVTVDDKVLQNNARQQAEEIVIDQVDRQFTPFMSTVKVGSEVRFPNSDNIRHHVYSFSKPKPFELKLYADNKQPTVHFNKSGVVTLGCNIHDQMVAHLLITEQQTAFITDQQGQVTLPLISDASGITVQVWHPWLGGDLTHAVSHQLVSSANTVELTVTPPQSEEKEQSRLQQRFNR